MSERHTQASCCGGPIRMDGETIIKRCVDCSQKATCQIGKAWKWFHGPLPYDCPLPKAKREEDEEEGR